VLQFYGLLAELPSGGSIVTGAGAADGSSAVAGSGAEIFKGAGAADGRASVSGQKYVPGEIVLNMSDLSKLLRLEAHDGTHIVSTLRDLVAASGNYDKTKVVLGDGSLSIVSIFVPPSTDPHISGAVWNSSGTLTISAG
jgi:hypothetical protein